MRIVSVLQGLDEGGAVATCCLNQVAALNDTHACSVISDGGPPAGAPAIQFQQVRVPALRWLRRYAHVPRQILFILKVGARLGYARPPQRIDLVLFHSHPPTALLAPLLQRRLGCRVVMVMHGDIFDRPRGTYDPRLTAWYSLCTSPAYRCADAVLALSPNMAKLAIHGGANSQHVHLVPNGVDSVEIGLDGSAPPPRGQKLLFVGRLEANKGIDLLLQAFRQLAPHHLALQLTCIGSPDVALLAPIQRQLQAEGLHSRVRFLPPQPRHSLGAFYAEAALVVIPSRSETQSTVAMEAMAAGRAVLASNTGGNPMLVDAPNTGLLFRSGDAADLAAQLERLISEPESLIAMGQAAAKRHQAEFTRQRSAEQLLKCVQSINAGINSNVIF
ncbi:glycosyltransferase family 4 protein [Cyanobium sp. BA5m-21]|uniref:glycosyltransferase family 4 protein n=1 Tax=unclassified Cyanobium TaxID=2627006 RepID=UPI0020CF4D36|nr:MULTISPECIES: glycosyltransferase family 4 protein [unclassified Cyanobium]MCP9903243.1 glycosyltransferase family 4 protein [Cyanobium sp. BA5m-10]MCP9907929.1 glycosyltransferase family 4 protein [Cyanobium sp. BA5m-21]